MSVAAIIVAAGRGVRLGGSTPKQFLELGGRTLLQRSVAAFDAHPAIARMIIVLPPDLVKDGQALVGPTARPVQFVAGGERRQDSVAAGAEALPPDADVVLIHDAARPFVEPSLIDRVIEAARATGAVVPAMQARDTVKRVAADSGVVAETIPRSEIFLAQTPQGFSRRVLTAALALAASGVEATDEAMLAELAGHDVSVIPGDPHNLKITTLDDVLIARARVAAPRVGTGYDLHRLVEGRPLVLAGVTLPSAVGPLGHSDGDVICHAVIDALFGAAGAGDIGLHFPNSDPRWAGAAGLDLLARAVTIVGEHGWKAASVDVTVVLERPKLSVHIAPIRARLAGVLGVPVSAVSVKGKTNEGVDAVGRGEAIAAHAVAVLSPS